jgi:hypothetical protein
VSQMLIVNLVEFWHIPTKRKLEVGFKLLVNSRLDDTVLKDIIGRYLSECAKNDLSFDSSIEPMIESMGFERLWKIMDKERLKEHFGEWSLYRWTELARGHKCEDN